MAQIKKVLFATKFEQLCYDALKSLIDLRSANLEHIVFINVIERDKVFMHRGGYLKDEERRLREAANIRFIDWAEALFEQGMEVGSYIVVGSLVAEIIKAAKKENADLIVIGCSPKGVIEQLYPGSEVCELLRRASAPVLVFKTLPDTTVSMFKRPLLATDWSPASMRAVDYLKDMKPVIDEVTIVHVAAQSELTGTTSLNIQKVRKEKRKKLDDICDMFEEHGIRAKSHLYVGDKEDEIERAARDHGVSMIVLGSTGKSVWQEQWLGSTPKTIAEKSSFPTLLIPYK